MTIKDNNKCFILAVDIETSGSNLISNKINGIGLALMSLNLLTKEIIVEEELECGFPCQYPQDYEEKCLVEFWDVIDESRNLDGPKARQHLENIIPNNCTNSNDVWKIVLDFISKCQDRVPYLRFVSDNPSFDIPRINYELNYYLNEKPLEFRRPKIRQLEKDEVYGSIIGTSDIARGLLLKQEGTKAMVSRKWVSPYDINGVNKENCPFVHDHSPVSDAKNIGWKYLCMLSVNL